MITKGESIKAVKEWLQKMATRTGMGTMKYGCGTPFVYALHHAVEDFKNGRPVREGITIDEVIMTLYDDWTFVGQMFTETEETPFS